MTSLIRTVLGLLPAIFISTLYFDLKTLDLGFYLIVFFFNLIITGWSIGFIVSGLVLRYGQSFEELAWAFIFLLLPFSCVYYPLSSLPDIIQNFAIFISPVYIFEGMREIIIFNNINFDFMIKAFLLNVLYLSLSIFFFYKMIISTKKSGKFLNYGE